ncbi:MAG: hypothetical protein Tp1124SUR00d2C54018391_1 [Prokaryotic dsDNA virus sp.]|nr:MAG: hypothetical protein Tp1124SUR00d2C54018391_1 [Prokaryotic dsDNA virus sp.]
MHMDKAKKSTKSVGRPKKYDIDTKEVEKLAAFGCTNTEIASFFGCSKDLISKKYSTNIAKGKDAGKIRLRKMQWNAADRGSVPMLIWLGKQVLGQTDKQEVTEVKPIDDIVFDGI